MLVLVADDAGSLLLTTPALRQLRRGLPQARIDLVAAAGAELLHGTGIVDRVFSRPVNTGGLARMWRRTPDLVLDFRPGTDATPVHGGRILRLGPAGGHEIARRLAVLDAVLPAAAVPPSVEIGFSAGEEGWAAQRLADGMAQEEPGEIGRLSVLLHATPDWPPEHWEELARAILAVPEARLFLSGMPLRLPPLPRCAPLGAVPNGLAMAAFVGRVDLLVCGASLPMHMVGATETPAVLLLTAADAIRYAPLAGEPRLVVAPGDASLTALPAAAAAGSVGAALAQAIERRLRRPTSLRRNGPAEPRSLLRRPDDAPKR